MLQLESAMKIAVRAHRHQLDKGGKPYIKHPTRMAKVAAPLGPEIETICWLHDVVEDTDFFKFPFPKRVRNIHAMESHLVSNYGFSIEQAKSLLAITKLDGEKHWTYLPRVKEDFVASVVKIIDIEDNLSPERLHCLPYDQQVYLIKKYTHSRAYLLDRKENKDG